MRGFSMSLPTARACRIEAIGPVYDIILGSPVSGRISDEYRQRAIELCAATFDSFTVIRSDGYFKGKLEESLLFKIATLEPEKVTDLAAQLAVVFDQDGVGLLQPASPVAASQVYSRVIPNRPAMAG
jgi:hypothetical protein